MSTNTTQTPEAAGGPAAPRAVATYDTYDEAERAVDALADNGFPVDRVMIVGRGLHMVEQVTGRMTYGGSALRGALTGAVTGALIGWLFWLFNWFAPIVAGGWLILDGLWFGAVVGAIWGLLVHAATAGRRDFASMRTMRADRYELLVDEAVADEARELLAREA